MAAAGVPTAAARVCATSAEINEALHTYGPPYVVKDDGLAAGKGVIVTEDRQAAERHAAGLPRVVIEEYLDGPEVSLFALSDGVHRNDRLAGKWLLHMDDPRFSLDRRSVCEGRRRDTR